MFKTGDQLTKLIASSPKKSVLSRIFYEKTRFRPDMTEERRIFNGSRCLVPKVSSPTNEIGKIFQSEIFFVGERTIGNLILASSFMFEGISKKLWISENNLYDYYKVIYYDEDKPRIGRT